jgi:hypothetical protein
MAMERLPMRQIRAILRLKWTLQRSHRETAGCHRQQVAWQGTAVAGAGWKWTAWATASRSSACGKGSSALGRRRLADLATLG